MISEICRRWDWLSNAVRHRLLTATLLRHARARSHRQRLAHSGTGSVAAAFAPLCANGVQIIRTGGLAPLGIDEAVVARLAAVVAGGASHLEGDALLAVQPAAYHLGLAPALLDLAEAYLGQPCFYLGAVIKREAADGGTAGSRNWHLDIEDERMLRILIYLSPAGPGSGPFEFVAAARSQAARHGSGYRSGYLSDAAMRAIVPAADWHAAFGDTGDAIVFDGTRAFHRAQPPSGADRYSLTLAYNSRRPLQLRRSARLSHRVRAAVVARVSARAAACIPPGRS